MVERGDALFGDDRIVFMFGGADVEVKRLGKADASPVLVARNLGGKSA